MVPVPFKAQLKFHQAKPHQMEWHALIDLLESIEQGLKINASVKDRKAVNNNDKSGETNKSKKKGKKTKKPSKDKSKKSKKSDKKKGKKKKK